MAARTVIGASNVGAYVVLRADAARPTSQDVIRFTRERVGYKAPEVIVVIEEMPLTASSKVDRMALKRMAEERLDAHPG